MMEGGALSTLGLATDTGGGTPGGGTLGGRSILGGGTPVGKHSPHTPYSIISKSNLILSQSKNIPNFSTTHMAQ